MKNVRSDPMQPNTPLSRPLRNPKDPKSVITLEEELEQVHLSEIADLLRDAMASPCQKYASAGRCCFGFQMGRAVPCLICRYKEEFGVWCGQCGQWHGKSRITKSGVK